MTASQRTTVTAGTLMVVLLCGSLLTLKRINGLRTSSNFQEVLYISSPTMVKRLSLGYTGLMADIYWTRAVQYFGWHRAAHVQQYPLLAPLLQMTTDLDPHLMIAYEFGANFLAAAPPQGAGEPERAIQLIEHGIRENPNSWRLYYDLGFIYYFDKNDYAQAAKAFAQGAEIPGAHPFLKILAASMAQHAGEIGMARLMWTTTLESSQDKQIQENARQHLRALKADEDIATLEKIAGQYRQKTGHWPDSFQQLIEARLLPGVPVDPLGKPYKLVPEGHFEVTDATALPFINKGNPAVSK